MKTKTTEDASRLELKQRQTQILTARSDILMLMSDFRDVEFTRTAMKMLKLLDSDYDRITKELKARRASHAK